MLEFFYLLNLILLPRLFFYFKDEPTSIKQLIIKSAITIVFFILIEIEIFSILLLVVILIIYITAYRIEKRYAKINVVRFLELTLLAVLINLFASNAVGLHFSETVLKFCLTVSNIFLFTQTAESADWYSILAVSSGLLLVLNEVNILIRIIFQEFDLTPKSVDKELDEKEYNAGRIIGMLERIILFALVMLNQFGTIGLIIAAKAFARFKALDKREFAEYVLIGTLLSVGLSLGVTLWIKYLIL